MWLRGREVGSCEEGRWEVDGDGDGGWGGEDRGMHNSLVMFGVGVDSGMGCGGMLVGTSLVRERTYVSSLYVLFAAGVQAHEPK